MTAFMRAFCRVSIGVAGHTLGIKHLRRSSHEKLTGFGGNSSWHDARGTAAYAAESGIWSEHHSRSTSNNGTKANARTAACTLQNSLIASVLHVELTDLISSHGCQNASELSHSNSGKAASTGRWRALVGAFTGTQQKLFHRGQKLTRA